MLVNQGDGKPLGRTESSSVGPFFHRIIANNHVEEIEVQQDRQKLNLEHLLLQNTPQSPA